jgi:Leucine-rich repeat (LRR) protein
MTQQELLEKIRQAVADGVTELDLSNNQLTELPKEIWQLTGLTTLTLSNNRLTELPKGSVNSPA